MSNIMKRRLSMLLVFVLIIGPPLYFPTTVAAETEEPIAEDSLEDYNTEAEDRENGSENYDDLLQSPVIPTSGPLPEGVPFAPTNDRVVTDVSSIYENLKYLADNGGGRLTLNLPSSPILASPIPAITISEDMTITLYAPTPVTLITLADFRHFTFKIDPGCTLTLRMENITLDGNNSTGGIVTTSSGTLVLESGTIVRCRSLNTGGAILAEGNLVINGGTIQDNKSTGGAGGGICVEKGNCTISGGAIIDNLSVSSGGGIALMQPGATLKITSGVIANNTASTTTGFGGGIYVGATASDNSYVQISGGEIYGNTAFRGGGVYADNCQVMMTAGTIGSQSTPNAATGIGGGLFASKLTMSGGEITGNEAKATMLTDTGAGGGIYASESCIIKGNAKITGNRAGRGGGILTAVHSNLEISENAQITGNQAIENGSPTLCGAGAGIQAEGNVLISGGRITNNKTQGNPANIAGVGGGIHFYPGAAVGAQTATLKITGGEISGNGAANRGGGVMIEHCAGSNYTYNIEVSGGTITGNEASSGGGIYITPLINSPTVQIQGNALLSGNLADNGGGIYSGVNLILGGSAVFIGNTASADGGGIYMDGSAQLRVSGGRIGGPLPQDANKATLGGGVYLNSGSDAYLFNGRIAGNQAVTFGGGIYSDDSLGHQKIRAYNGFVFSGNQVADSYEVDNVNLAALSYSAFIEPGVQFSNPFTVGWNNNDISFPGINSKSDRYYLFTFHTNAPDGVYLSEKISPFTPVPVNRPANPSRAGYDFTDWYQEPACINPWNFSVPVTATTTVYAGWLGTLHAQTPNIIQEPEDTMAERNGNVTLFVSAAVADGGSLSYQWYESLSPSYSGLPIPGAHQRTYTPSTSAMGNKYYYVEITNTNYNSSVTGDNIAAARSQIAEVRVVSLLDAQTPVISLQPQNGVLPVELSVTANVTDGGTLSYQWYSNQRNTNSGGAPITGGNLATFTPQNAGYYYVSVTNTNLAAARNTQTVVSSNSVLVSEISAGGSSRNGSRSTANIVIRCVDSVGNLLLTKTWFAVIGNTIDIEAPEIEGYRLLGNSILSQSVKAGNNPITFTYEKIDPNELELLETLTVHHNTYLSGYPDGTFRPDSSITRGEAAQLIYNLVCSGLLPHKGDSVVAVVFADIGETDWYYEAVLFLAETGAVSGYPDGTFKPDEPVTRAEFTAMAARLLGLSMDGKTNFPDVTPDHWAFGAIAAMENSQFIGGYPNNNFGPDDGMTRAQAVTILNNVLGRDAIGANFNGVTIPFTDVPEDHWAFYEIMAAAVAHTVSSGE